MTSLSNQPQFRPLAATIALTIGLGILAAAVLTTPTSSAYVDSESVESPSATVVTRQKLAMLETSIAGGIGMTEQGEMLTWGHPRNNTRALPADEALRMNLVSAGSVLEGKTITHLELGGFTAVVLDDTGTAYGWGLNMVNTLGIPEPEGMLQTNYVLPRQVFNGGSLANKKIAATCGSRYVRFAIDTEGDIHAMGENSNGIAGTGEWEYVAYPTLVSQTKQFEPEQVRSCAVGGTHVLALTESGRIFAWGANSHGQVGTGSFSNAETVPREVDIPGRVVQIAAGYNFSFALTEKGQLYAWGAGGYGQTANPSVPSRTPYPEPVNMAPFGGKEIAYFEAPLLGEFVVALTTDGSVFTWGRNNDGQLGQGSTNEFNPLPTVINAVHGSSFAGRKATQISCWQNGCAVLDEDGYVSAWGNNTGSPYGPPAPSSSFPVPALY